jgi:O-antigen/teichoic acid export membrane protein
MQDEPDAMRRVYRKGNLYSCYLLFPAMAGMALVAEPLVEVLLTKKWLPCVPYLQLFCVIGAILPIRHLNSYLFKAVDRVGLALKLQLTARCVSVIMLIITCTISIEAILIGEIISTFVLVGIFTYFGGRLIQYPVRKQLLDMLPYLFITVAMAGCVYSIRFLSLQNPFLLLVAQIVAGVLIYILLSHAFRFDPYLEICRTVQNLKARFLVRKPI